MPYTCVILVEGMILAVVDYYMTLHYNECGMGILSKSIAMWKGIDPHLLLYAFLPALLFGDAMALNIHLQEKCFSKYDSFVLSCAPTRASQSFYRMMFTGQCLLLAGPGVLMGTFATGAVAKYAFTTYDWDWNLCFTFGSIMSATDPVAVVALLKSLGASAKLTMVITGESLLNDGTAMVIFLIFEEMTFGKTYTVGEGVSFFCQLALAGPAFGIFIGFLIVQWIKRADHKASHVDVVIQVSLTLACAYLAFFLGEESLKVSGVLATVFAAESMAMWVWPVILDKVFCG
jgi:NhaP-type Na+/H+ or K+/H+ antiporter